MRVPPPAAAPPRRLMTVHPSASVSDLSVKTISGSLFSIYAVNLSFFCDMFIFSKYKK
jgi:hypothetical protein